MKKKTASHSTDIIFILGLVCLFGICSLVVVLFGGRVYKNIVESSTYTAQRRTAFSYLSNKIRSADGQDIELAEENGLQVLRLTEKLESGEYQTYFYYYDGALRELTLAAGDDFVPESGETVTEASGLSFTREGSLLRYTLSIENDESLECSLLLRVE